MGKKLRSSILAKLLLGTILVLLIPFIIANIYTYRMNYSEALAKTVEENRGLIGVGLDSLEEYFGRLNEIPLGVYESAAIYGTLQKSEEFTQQEQHSLRRMLETMVGQDTSIRRAEFICRNGSTIRQEEIGEDNKKDWRNAQYRDSQERIRAGYDDQGEVSVLKYGLELLDVPSTKILVQANFCCVPTKLESIIKKVGADDKENIVVGIFMNASRSPLYANKLMEQIKYQQFQKGYSVGTLNGVQGFFFVGTSNHSGEELRIVKFVPQSMITAPINNLIQKVILVQVGIFIFVIIFIIYIYKNMLQPIKNIARNIDRVQEGQYEYHASCESDDEIGELDRKYEEMVATINTLINKDLKNALEISKGRLRALQAQINPHFLNNMLQTISTQALKAGDWQASDSISKLARIFQYNMDTSMEFVPLSMELRQTQTYLALQQSRFRERLEYSIDCEAGLKSITIPKMIIQPLVENSLKHGMNQLERTTIIIVKIYQHEGVNIEVVDNGKGVSKEKIQSLKEDFKNYEITPEAGHGIGLMNVLQRLEIYSNDFAWDIQSILDVETKVSIRFSVPKEVL